MVYIIEGNSNNDNNPLDSTLLMILNNANINGTNQLYMDTLNLLHNSSKILNSTDTSDEALAELQLEKQNLLQSIDNIEYHENLIRTQISSELGNSANDINGSRIRIDDWIKKNSFEEYNSNKISSIEVHYNSDSINGIKIIKSDNIEDIKGIINNSTNIETIDFDDDEFLTQIKIKSDSSITGLCKQISFYTNKLGIDPKKTIPSTLTNIKAINKEYFFSNQKKRWEWHNQNAINMGYELVCFNNIQENNFIKEKYRSSHWIGLYHVNVDEGNYTGTTSKDDNAGWKWVDGTPYERNKSNWNSGEPNNCCAGEPFVNVWSNGKWNDHSRTAEMPAVYQKQITNIRNQLQYYRRYQIINFDFNPFRGNYDKIYIIDQDAIRDSQQVSNEMRSSIETLFNTTPLFESILVIFHDTKNRILNNINTIDNRIDRIISLNQAGGDYLDDEQNYKNMIEQWQQQQSAVQQPTIQQSTIQGFKNINDNNIIKNLFNFFFNNKEGNTNMNTGIYNQAIDSNSNETTKVIANTLNKLDNLRNREINNAVTEFITKKDNIFTRVLSDYMLNNEKQTNIENVYNKIDQLNDDKARKIEINTYYNKAYKEYINILKVIILVCIIIVPIVIANKNNMIPNNVTMFLVVAIIFLTVIFIIYKFSDIYMRDNKNFDKLRIPYDREAALLEKQGVIIKKKNPLTSLTLTCIGEDCCDGSMVYDFAKNKCILSENFGGYFESMNNFDSGRTSIVEVLGGTINEGFANCKVKQSLVTNSLNCSDTDKFYSNECLRRIDFNF